MTGTAPGRTDDVPSDMSRFSICLAIWFKFINIYICQKRRAYENTHLCIQYIYIYIVSKLHISTGAISVVQGQNDLDLFSARTGILIVSFVAQPQMCQMRSPPSELFGSACPCCLPQTVYRMFSSSSESKMASAKYIAPSSSTWWASGTNYYWSNKPIIARSHINSQAAKQFVELYHSPKL